LLGPLLLLLLRLRLRLRLLWRLLRWGNHEERWI
jgi:hypothetical protein